VGGGIVKAFWDKAIHLAGREAGIQTQYGIAAEGNTVWLSIQGSIQKEDWLANFDFPAVPYKNQATRWLAHAGFVKRWKAARDQITSDVLALWKPGMRLHITGYSHGAALATLAHEDFWLLGLEPVTAVFGSPRVLWMPPEDARLRFENLDRVENPGDIVTVVPPAAFGYRHVGRAYEKKSFRFPLVRHHLIAEYNKLLA